MPQGAWDAFAWNSADEQELALESFPTFRGPGASSISRLPPRLACISNWIMNVANQPATLWWAVQQEALHPSVRSGIAWQLERTHESCPSDLRKAWKYVLESWESPSRTRRDWYDLKRNIEHDGWTSAAIREFAKIMRPYLQAKSSFSAEPIPPAKGEDVDIIHLVRIEVEWPDLPSTAEIPDEWLTHVIRVLRHNIESAIQLSDEVGDWAPSQLVPIVADPSPDINDFQRTRDLSGYIIGFVALFERLLALDFHAAELEAASWLRDDQSVFARLRIWVAGNPKLTSPVSFIEIIEGLSNDSFWDSYHQRDLLLTLSKRWADLSEDLRKQIEGRILAGPDRWDDEPDNDYQDRKARNILNRLQWLIDQGCQLTFDPTSIITQLRRTSPIWRPEYAKHATDSREARGGFVSTNLEHDQLLREPIGTILVKALELAGREPDNLLSERDPFAGLCAKNPQRAYLALIHSARKKEYPKWAWKKFLDSQARKEDVPKFSAVIAARLCKIPDQAMVDILYSCTYWLHNVHRSLSAEQPEVFDKITTRLIDIVALSPTEARSAIVSSRTGRGWSTDALNSPAGHIALAVLEDSRIQSADGKFRITLEWLARLEKLLQLNGDPLR